MIGAPDFGRCFLAGIHGAPWRLSSALIISQSLHIIIPTTDDQTTEQTTMASTEATQHTTMATTTANDSITDDDIMILPGPPVPQLPTAHAGILQAHTINGSSRKMPGVKTITRHEYRSLAQGLIGIMSVYPDSYIDKTSRDRGSSTAWRTVTNLFFDGPGRDYTPYGTDKGWVKLKALGLALLKHYSDVYEENLATHQPILELERKAYTMQEERMNALEAIARDVTAKKQATASRNAVNLVYENALGLRAPGRGPTAPRLEHPITQNEQNALGRLGINPTSPDCK